MPAHVPTCLCPACERSGGGDFAVRAYAQGDRAAGVHLSKRVAALLPSIVVELPSRVLALGFRLHLWSTATLIALEERQRLRDGR